MNRRSCLLVAACAMLAGAAVDPCDFKPSRNQTGESLLEMHASVCESALTTKRVHGASLAYVTPWNNRGYDNAKRFAAKLTYISPVWLQVRPSKDTSAVVEVTGTHDVDKGWMEDVRRNGGCYAQQTSASVGADGHASAGPATCPRIVPRVAWEVNAGKAGVPALLVGKAVEAIAAAVKAFGFDGIVLECPTTEPYRGLITGLANALHRLTTPSGRPAVLIQVLAPNVVQPAKDGAPMQVVQGIQPTAFASLATVVDAFSLMTYDYGVHRGKPDGPNAPLWWVKDAVNSLIPDGLEPSKAAELRAKVLLGVPFYGYDSGEAILGHRFLDLLRAHPASKLKYEPRAVEHVLQYEETVEGGGGRRKRTVHYPTPYFISKRVEAANELGTGLSIWEIGQGLDCLFDQI